MPKPWRPSNGTEGDIFISNFCDKCDFYINAYCDILDRAFLYELGDLEYPKEWQSNDDGSNPHCTSFYPLVGVDTWSI